jgi:rubrerythrin
VIIVPFGNIWTCTNCGHSVRTAGLFKFYIDNNGIRHRCGHPIPSEAEKRYGASGYSLEGYCPFHGVRDVIIAEFEPQREFKNICDVCGEKLLDNLKNLSCPKCGKGKFKEAARWMS